MELKVWPIGNRSSHYIWDCEYKKIIGTDKKWRPCEIDLLSKIY